jgi:hypothetical protein
MFFEIMKIDILKKIDFDELERMVRGVPLLKKREDGSNVYVYENADISLRELGVNDVNPTSFYVIGENLQTQRDLRKALSSHGVDILHLEGAYEIKNERGHVWTLMPPVVEVAEREVFYVPQDGEIEYLDKVKLNVPIINDGMHRAFLARELGESFNAVYVSGALSDFPFYAHPNSWDKIKEVVEVPATKVEKKFYSREDCYGLYRDFGVLGCGAPRGTSK